MSKQRFSKAAATKRLQPTALKAQRPQSVRAKESMSDARATGVPAVIRRSGNLGNGLYVIQFLEDAGDVPENELGLGLAPGQLQRVPKMNHAQLAEAVARLEKAVMRAAEPVLPKENVEFLARFKKKELKRWSQLEASGTLVGSQALADLMGVTRQAITKAEAELRMFSLDGASGKKLYPAFFADDEIDRRAIQKVSKALDRLAGASKWQFFTNPRLSLGKTTPLEALRKGKVVQVMTAAIAFREA